MTDPRPSDAVPVPAYASPYLRRLPDGTVKQRNPFTGTEVWTVPGRGNRPFGLARPEARPLDPAADGRHCAFCSARKLETPPEKSRVVRRPDGAFETLRHGPVEGIDDTVAEFRRVPNLFEILSFDYWRTNHGYELPAAARRHRDEYLATDAGRAHVGDVVGKRMAAAGETAERIAGLTDDEVREAADGFFGGGHDVIVARRHHVDGATDDHQLAGSGTLTPEEHHAFIAFTAESARDLYAANPHVRYVSVFQNWLKPAGASFDHLHKQLVAIDEIGTQNEAALDRVREDPDVFNAVAVDEAIAQGLVIADNEHAVLFAGFGHRYPTLEVYSRSAASEPWAHSPEELRAMSDLLHAAHAATGADVPCNEEWHTRPAGVSEGMPWRVMLKWRVSTLAGFEGATKIYLNTVSPWGVRERTLARLTELRGAGRIAEGIRLGDEVALEPGSLRYS